MIDKGFHRLSFETVNSLNSQRISICLTAVTPTFLSMNPLHFFHFSVLYLLLFHQQSVLLHHKLGLLLKLLPVEENGAREHPTVNQLNL